MTPAKLTEAQVVKQCEYCGREESILPSHLSWRSCIANLQEDVIAARAEGRAQGIEESAKVCAYWDACEHSGEAIHGGMCPLQISEAIRDLAKKEGGK